MNNKNTLSIRIDLFIDQTNMLNKTLTLSYLRKGIN